MGIIRGALLVLVCILLFLSLLFTGIFATLNVSLKYDNVNSHLNLVIKETFQKQGYLSAVEKNQKTLESHCNNSSNFSGKYTFKEEKTNRTFLIPCEVISNGTDSVIDYEINELANESYHKKYDCEFWKCFEEKDVPLFLVSEHAKDYWRAKYYLFLGISVFLAFLLFLLVENKINFAFIAGIILIISFLPITMIEPILSLIIQSLLSPVNGAIKGLGLIDLSSLISIFFNKSHFVFLTGFIIGIVLIALGILIKLFGFGLKLEKWISKREEDKKEEKDIKKQDFEKTLKDKKGESF